MSLPYYMVTTSIVWFIYYKTLYAYHNHSIFFRALSNFFGEVSREIINKKNVLPDRHKELIKESRFGKEICFYLLFHQ